MNDNITDLLNRISADVQALRVALDSPPVVASPAVYSQRDPKWASLPMGFTRNTIGAYGCLISSVASCLTDAGKVYTPETLNAWLTLNGGYTGGNFIFNSIDKLNVLKYEYLIDCPSTPAPMTQLEQEISAGKFIVIKVDFNPATLTIEEHWGRYIGADKMIDPWYGDIATITPRYRGASSAQAILRAAVYRRV
jgi:hypothetical protein